MSYIRSLPLKGFDCPRRRNRSLAGSEVRFLRASRGYDPRTSRLSLSLRLWLYKVHVLARRREAIIDMWCERRDPSDKAYNKAQVLLLCLMRHHTMLPEAAAAADLLSRSISSLGAGESWW